MLVTVSGLWDQRSGPAAEADLWKLGLGFIPCPALLRASLWASCFLNPSAAGASTKHPAVSPGLSFLLHLTSGAWYLPSPDRSIWGSSSPGLNLLLTPAPSSVQGGQHLQPVHHHRHTVPPVPG